VHRSKIGKLMSGRGHERLGGASGRSSNVRNAPLGTVARKRRPVVKGPGRVKTLRGITAPGILRLVVTLRAKKCKNSSSAQRYNQIRFRFHTAWAKTGPDVNCRHRPGQDTCSCAGRDNDPVRNRRRFRLAMMVASQELPHGKQVVTVI
jgi:hypothetical protein